MEMDRGGRIGQLTVRMSSATNRLVAASASEWKVGRVFPVHSLVLAATGNRQWGDAPYYLAEPSGATCLPGTLRVLLKSRPRREAVFGAGEQAQTFGRLGAHVAQQNAVRLLGAAPHASAQLV